MIKIVLSLFVVLFAFGCQQKVVQENIIPVVLTSESVQETVIANFPELQGATVIKSVVEPLYEVNYEGNTVYTTDGNYIIIGMIFDKERKNITSIATEPPQSAPVDLSELDLSLALKIGDGKHQVIEFTDVDCPFCRRAEAFFDNADVTRYIFFMELVSPEARVKSIHVLCSENPQDEYFKVISDSVKQYDNCEKGRVIFEQHMGYARKMNVNVAPMFYINGLPVEGADPKIRDMIR